MRTVDLRLWGVGALGKGAGSSELPRWHIFLEKRVRLQRIETWTLWVTESENIIVGGGGGVWDWGPSEGKDQTQGRIGERTCCGLTQAFSPSGSALARPT